MKISIKHLDAATVHLVNQCDGSFIVDAVLKLCSSDGCITYTIDPVPGYVKRYATNDINPAAYVGRPDRAGFLAFVDGQLAGQILASEKWNRYACIDDLAVDVHHRRLGVGTALMARAAQWARGAGLPGVTLETQNNNAGACRFYESFGFHLAGFDAMLYRGLSPGTDEIALYWYLLF